MSDRFMNVRGNFGEPPETVTSESFPLEYGVPGRWFLLYWHQLSLVMAQVLLGGFASLIYI